MAHSKPTLILTILLLNVACSTATTNTKTMRRHQVSVGPDGHMQEEKMSESLSALANMFPDQPAEKGVIASLLKLSETGPSDDLMNLVKDLKSQIMPWHATSTSTLQTAIEAFSACDASMADAMARSETEKATCTAESTSHTTQRTEENTDFTTNEHWSAVTAEKKEDMDKECGIFDDVKQEVRSAKASWTGGDEGAYLESVSQEFCSGLLPRYNEAKQKCTAATAAHAEAEAKYEAAKTAYTEQKAASDTIQTEMDVSCCACALSTKDACKTHGTCYEDEVAKYEAVKTIIESEEKIKKTEWRVYSRIECLLPVLGTDNAAKIEECRAKTHSTAHLDIDYPAVPEKSKCNVEEAYPGTQGYYDTHFGALPENAKGKDVAACTGMESEGTLVMKAQAHSSGYRFWKLEMRQNDNPTCQVFQEIEFICNGEKRTGVNALEASDHYLSYHASKAVDGNEDTYWAKCFGGQGAVDWITFDLGTPCSLTDVKTKARAHKSMQMQPDVMLLQASTTGEDGTWEDVHEWNNPNNPNWQEIAIPEGSGR